MYDAVCPGVTVDDGDVAEKLKSIPVPESGTVCGLTGALSEIVSVPVRAPATEGSKKTLIVQPTPGATVVVQPFVAANSVAVLTPIIVSGASPVLVRVTFWGKPVVPTNWSGKVRLVGERLTVGPSTPVPLRAITCGLSPALSVIVIVPEIAPLAVGMNVAAIMQLAPGATEAPQVVPGLEIPKFALAAILVILNGRLPLLFSVTVWAVLVVPTSWLAKERLAGDRLTIGAPVPVPVRLIMWRLPAALSVMIMDPFIVPATLGENVTLIVHCDPPAATEVPQVFVSAKSSLTSMLVIVNGLLP